MDIEAQEPQAAQGEKTTIGNTVEVRFTSFNRSASGKVDTGATTSSLHATKISMNGGQVSFHAPDLSDNIITVEAAGSQEVRSADGGGNSRPVVKLEVEVAGKNLGPVEFNLNDRGEMESSILIGQNILSAGNFLIDVQQGGEEGGSPADPAAPVDNTARIREAVQVLRDANVTLSEIMVYLQTEAMEKLQA